MSDWIQTFSGKCFYPLDPRPEDVSLIDIAHALSMKCRFGGHSSRFYSVCEHSIRVAEIVPKQHLFHALLHDAAEAYLPDICAPIKRDIAVKHAGVYLSFKFAENRVLQAIYEAFGVSPPTLEAEQAIKHADLTMLATEARDLMGVPPKTWIDLPPPIEEDLTHTSEDGYEYDAIQFRRIAKLHQPPFAALDK